MQVITRLSFTAGSALASERHSSQHGQAVCTAGCPSWQPMHSPGHIGAAPGFLGLPDVQQHVMIV